ncbi:2-hydroxyacid dehydrogenase [Falsiroseomonas sp.]|uniref:2-hydroxyacid dehydrogenase n=1 Tax=Falsiroseomonas sp. TaxID=2870721 RepID=UPI00273521A2|nr:2-hydroxyacid dehydrogenase [Falsiroseomonas sp.]MDP3415492.1 2-hydroxyacid dehydrogenase [Falsiroseomonas sp.]
MAEAKVVKILVLAQHAPQAARLQSLLGAGFEVTGIAAFPDQGPIEAEVVVTTHVTPDQASRLRCRLLHVPGAGLDGIALDAVPAGCAVANVFGHEIPMAEFAMFAMLEHCIRPAEMPGHLDAATWPAAYRGRTLHEEVAGKTLGLVGFGHIGRELARRARAFDMRVAAVSRRGGDVADADWVRPASGLEEMLPMVDFLVLCCPLTQATRGLINEHRLRRMKPSAVLISLGRAEIAVEEDLFHAMQNRQIAAAYLDVWYRYPKANETTLAPSRFPFHELANVRCTPHASAWTEQLLHRRYDQIARNIRRLDTDGAFENLVRQASQSP